MRIYLFVLEGVETLQGISGGPLDPALSFGGRGGAAFLSLLMEADAGDTGDVFLAPSGWKYWQCG